MASHKPLILGEAPGRNGDPDRPLAGAAGKRLALMAGYRHWDELIDHFDLMNLLYEYPGEATRGGGAAFPGDEAREAQAGLWEHLRGRVVVLLGARLRRLYRVPEFHRWVYNTRRGVAMAAVPHPSGLTRLYNSHEEREKTAKILRQAQELPVQLAREL
jgi:uracil-DNA glycosylase